MKEQKKKHSGITSIGTKTPFGKVVGILYIGERYYMTMNKSMISLMPADLIETLEQKKGR